MGYLALYKALEEEGLESVIQDWELFCEEPEDFVITYHSANAWLPLREFIARKHADDRVKEADIRLIKAVLKVGADAYYPDEGENYPLSHWWFYLDKISQKTYPAELLPEYLREIYLKAQEGGF